MTGQIAGDNLYVMGGIEILGEGSSIVSEVWKFNLTTLTETPDFLFSNEDFRILPNPTFGLTTIHCKGFDKSSVTLYSLNGDLLYSKEAEGSSYQFDLSFLQKGVYLITIRSKDYIATEKIVKL